jgi:hypothetical protein
MKPGLSRSLLKCKPIKMGGIESVPRGPAIESVTYIRGNTLFTCNADEKRNETVIAFSM